MFFNFSLFSLNFLNYFDFLNLLLFLCSFNFFLISSLKKQQHCPRIFIFAPFWTTGFISTFSCLITLCVIQFNASFCCQDLQSRNERGLVLFVCFNVVVRGLLQDPKALRGLNWSEFSAPSVCRINNWNVWRFSLKSWRFSAPELLLWLSGNLHLL